MSDLDLSLEGELCPRLQAVEGGTIGEGLIGGVLDWEKGITKGGLLGYVRDVPQLFEI